MFFFINLNDRIDKQTLSSFLNESNIVSGDQI
jgi:hypothetical protein